MSSVDQRVVQMKFDNAQFEQGIRQTLKDLDTLNKSLKLSGGAQGLNDIGAAAGHVHFAPLISAVESLSGRFKSLSVVGVTALSTITNKVISAGAQMVKSFTLGPITAGFHNYETQINAVQTIMANTGLEGKKGLATITKALDELNKYANKTVYNFAEMAENIGTFTAAGVGLKESVSSIKGIANLAALSGASSAKASGAMYQLSQAIATGTVHLQDWNSVVQAGLGGKKFQNALIATARASGVSIDSIIKKAGSFRDSLQDGWLTSKILTKTLSQFTGDLSLKQIEAMGFTEKEAQQIFHMGQVAVKAATQIKTASQLTQALREEVGTAWGAVFKTIFGDINQATALFSGLHTVAENALTGPIYALNNLLEDWAKLGGRTKAIDAISNAFNFLGDVLRPIKDAFREIFPPATAQQLFDITTKIDNFTKKLSISGKTSDEIKRTFAGLFAILRIGWDILSPVVGLIGHIIGVIALGAAALLPATASLGDFIVKLEAAIRKSGIFAAFFGTIGKYISVPLELLQMLGTAISNLFDKFDGSKAEKTLGDVSTGMEEVSKHSNEALVIWNAITGTLDKVTQFIDKVAKKITDFFTNLGTGGSVANNNFKGFLSSIDTGLFGGLLLLVNKIVNYFKSGRGGAKPFQSITETLLGPFNELTNTLKTMQSTLKAATLLEIAAAVALLALAVSTLSKIDQAGLIRSSIALGVMFGQLIGSMALFQKFVGTAGFIKLPFMMASMILLAFAVDILASAVVKLAKLDWNGLAKGLLGLAGIMFILAGGIRAMGTPKNLILTGFGLAEIANSLKKFVDSVETLSKLSWSGLAKGLIGLTAILTTLALFTKFSESGTGAIKTAALLLLATAIKILVSAVKDFSNMSWEEMAKGLSGIAILLTSLTLFTKFAKADKGGLSQGLGILLLATAIKILASAIKDMGKMSWESIAKGLIAMAGGLAIMGAALRAVPPSSILSAAAIFITAASLKMISDALQSMGGMSWGEIAKSLVELAGALTIIALALNGMDAALPGAAALIVAAYSLNIIADVLIKMGNMSWGEILKSLVELAVSLDILAGALLAMDVALPGAAALLVAAAALAILAPVLVAFGDMSWGEIIKSLFLLAGALTIIGIAGVLIEPAIPGLLGLALAVTLLGAGMLLAGTGMLLFATGLTALALGGTAAAAAWTAAITSIAKTIPVVAAQIALGLIAFGATILANAPTIIGMMISLLLAIINAIADNTPKITAKLARMVLSMLTTMNKYVPKLVSQGAKLIISILNGLTSRIGGIVKAATDLIVAFINAMNANQSRIIDAGVKMIIGFVNGLASSIRSHQGAMRSAGANLATAIIDGMTGGLASGIGRIVAQAKNIAGSAISAAKHALDINSPSKKFIEIGKSVNEGFVKGLKSGDKSKVDSVFKDMEADIKSLEKSSKSYERSRAKAAYALMNSKTYKSQHSQLDSLATKYATLTTKIKDANEALDAAIKTRDDYNKTVTDQYATLPTVDKDTRLGTYVKSLQSQIKDTQTFITNVQQLRDMGLNDEAYKQLIAAGPDSLPFVNQLLQSGQNGIDQINDLDSQLAKQAASLGSQASKDLYQAGVQAAAGLVGGLQRQQAAIQKEMDKIADAMVKAIKKKLHIKSPSKVFAEIGGYSAEGLAIGLQASSPIVEKSAADIGENALEALRATLSDVSSAVMGEIDVKPTIAPVLDLSAVKKDASQLGALLSAAPIAVDTTVSRANVASDTFQSNKTAADEARTAPGDTFQYNQYNNSPKALSEAEIYRQTKNQLSTVKEALDK